MLTVNEYRRGFGIPENPPQTISEHWDQVSFGSSPGCDSGATANDAKKGLEHGSTSEMVSVGGEK